MLRVLTWILLFPQVRKDFCSVFYYLYRLDGFVSQPFGSMFIFMGCAFCLYLCLLVCDFGWGVDASLEAGSRSA